MKIIVISDTHGQRFDHLIPQCDLLIHCGDISPVHDHSFRFQKQWFFDTFISDLSLVHAKHIVFVGGNHDYFLCETNISDNNNIIRRALPPHVHYLCDEFIQIEQLKIYGTPRVVLPNWARAGFPVWNFASREKTLKEIYSNIPDNLDILVSHGPAYGYSDTILEHDDKEHLGSKSLIEKIQQANPKYVFTGHIHSANHNMQAILDKNNSSPVTKFYGTSLLNESYKLYYTPLEIDLINMPE